MLQDRQVLRAINVSYQQCASDVLGEYLPEVLTVRTEHSEIRIKKTKG